MTEKTKKDVTLGRPDETGARAITAKIGAFVPLKQEEIGGYACLKNLKDVTKMEAVLLYDAQGKLAMTPLVMIYPEKGKSYLLDTTMNIPLAYGEENAVRVGISYLRLHDESIIKAAKEYMKSSQAAENSLETLRKALK